MKSKLLFRKFLVFAYVLMFFNIGSGAQPNIQHSIYLKEKICTDSFLARPVFTIQHSKGSCFMAYTAIDPDSTATFSNSVHFAKFNDNWDTVFTKVFNGHNNEDVNFINELPNGNLLISGSSQSEDGGIMFNDKPGEFIWIMELDTSGNFVKAKTFGSGSCALSDISITSDGYILLAGNTYANSYDFSHIVLGSSNAAWIAKYDTGFNKKWVRVIDGDGEDNWPTIKEISQEKYIIGYMSDGLDAASVPNEAKGKFDLIVQCIDSGANNIWTHRFGSVENDGSRLSVIDPITKDIYFVGYNEWSATGTVSYASGTCWIQKIDTFGNNRGSKSYGAATDITLRTDAIWYNKKLWVFGYSNGGGADMDPETNPKNLNAWVGEIDTSVNLIAKYSLVTAEVDYLGDAFTFNNELFANGFIASYVNPFKCDTNNITGIILNLGLAPLGINKIQMRIDDSFVIYPNPTNNTLHLRISDKFLGSSGVISVFDHSGKEIYRVVLRHLEAEEVVQCAKWKPGNYVIKLTINNKSESTKKFIKELPSY